MKSIIMKQLIYVAIMLAIQTTAMAQANNGTNKPPFVRPKIDSVVAKDVRLMKTILKLTPDQEMKILRSETVYMEARSKITATVSSTERRGKVTQLQQQYEIDLKTILTTQQYGQYLDEIERRKKMFEEKRKQKKPNG